MEKRQARTGKAVPLRPLDHLRPGEHSTRDHSAAAPPPASRENAAVTGAATRSPAPVETREHLEGSEQGPV